MEDEEEEEGADDVAGQVPMKRCCYCLSLRQNRTKQP